MGLGCGACFKALNSNVWLRLKTATGPHWSSHLGVHHTRLEGLLGANCNPQLQCLIQGIGGGSPEYVFLRSFQVMLLLLV